MNYKIVLAWDDVNQDRYGDEYRTWHVAVTDQDFEPIGKIYNCSTRNVALNLGEKMSKDRKLEFVNDMRL